MLDIDKKSKVTNHINSTVILILFFCLFSIFYLINFDKYNFFFSTDFRITYKPNGIINIEKLIDLKFSEINFFNFYLIPELITGFLLKIIPDETTFSTTINFLNIISLFLSIYFFLKSLFVKKKNSITTIFLLIFFIYVANWEWCFWKLADIYFLLIVSLVFYFITKGIREKDLISIVYASVFSLVSLITKPNGVIILPFLVSSIVLFFIYKKNFFKVIIFSFLIYLIFFPFLIFFLIKLNIDNIFVKAFLTGQISWNYLYTYSNFTEQFSLDKNSFSQLIYFYFLILKKLIYQLTFIRETYSFNHNLFLIFYVLFIYFFLIINFDYLIKKYNLFFKLTILLFFFSTILYCSIFISSEPNRFQLFYLVPTYILVSISLIKIFKNIKYSYNNIN